MLDSSGAREMRDVLQNERSASRSMICWGVVVYFNGALGCHAANVAFWTASDAFVAAICWDLSLVESGPSSNHGNQ